MALHADARIYVKQGQRDQRDIVRRVFRRMQPQVQLHARRHETTMRADNGLRQTRRATAHQHDGRIVWFGGATEVAPYRCVRRPMRLGLQTVLKPGVAGLEIDPMAVFLFLEQREERAKKRRQVFLDAGGDDVPDLRIALKVFHPFVKRRQRDDDLDAGRVERLPQFGAGVERIQGQHRGPRLPRPNLGNQELRAIRQQEGDAVSLLHTRFHERGGEPVAQPIEIRVRDSVALEQDRRCRRAVPPRTRAGNRQAFLQDTARGSEGLQDRSAESTGQP